MKARKILQDKINQARITPSARTWQKIEDRLERDYRSRSFKQRSVIGWAAALLIIVLAYYAGRYDGYSHAYMPEPLEFNDQAGKIQLPLDLYSIPASTVKYRNDGRLVPNYQALWKHPLIPRERNL